MRRGKKKRSHMTYGIEIRHSSNRVKSEFRIATLSSKVHRLGVAIQNSDPTRTCGPRAGSYASAILHNAGEFLRVMGDYAPLSA